MQRFSPQIIHILQYEQEHTRPSVRSDRQYPMGINGTCRQIRISRVLSSIRHYFPHGRCSSLFLVALTVLQTRAGRPSGYVEDILCRTLRTGIQSGSLYLRHWSMTSPIDASIVTTTLPIVTMIVAAIYLKEPVTNKKYWAFL